MKDSKKREHCSTPTPTPTNTYIETLRAYKKLSKNPLNHNLLLKDKTVLLFIATLLENKNEEILSLCLEILEDFINDYKNHSAIINTFGLYESLNTLFISLNSQKCSDTIHTKLNRILDMLDVATLKYPPRTKKLKTYSMYNVYLPDITKQSRIEYENIFLGTKGIVSFVIDLKSKTCMIRMFSSITIKSVVRNIQNVIGTTPLIIVKNKMGEKEYIDACDKSLSIKLDYEEQKSGIGAALDYVSNKYVQTKDTILGIIDSWNEYFYW